MHDAYHLHEINWALDRTFQLEKTTLFLDSIFRQNVGFAEQWVPKALLIYRSQGKASTFDFVNKQIEIPAEEKALIKALISKYTGDKEEYTRSINELNRSHPNSLSIVKMNVYNTYFFEDEEDYPSLLLKVEDALNMSLSETDESFLLLSKSEILKSLGREKEAQKILITTMDLIVNAVDINCLLGLVQSYSINYTNKSDFEERNEVVQNHFRIPQNRHDFFQLIDEYSTSSFFELDGYFYLAEKVCANQEFNQLVLKKFHALKDEKSLEDSSRLLLFEFVFRHNLSDLIDRNSFKHLGIPETTIALYLKRARLLNESSSKNNTLSNQPHPWVRKSQFEINFCSLTTLSEASTEADEMCRILKERTEQKMSWLGKRILPQISLEENISTATTDDELYTLLAKNPFQSSLNLDLDYSFTSKTREVILQILKQHPNCYELISFLSLVDRELIENR